MVQAGDTREMQAAETESSTHSWKANQKKGDTTQQWCALLETAIDGRIPGKQPMLQVEHHRIASSSRSGRIQWHSKSYVPPDLQPKKPRAQAKIINARRTAEEEAMAEEEEEQLIFMALYRDKIDKHQAALVKDAAKASAAAKMASAIARKERKERERRGLPVSEPVENANSSADATVQDAHLLQQHAEVLGRSTAVHTAAVNTTSSKGALSEHFEAKRLGKLFDEWQAKQQEDPSVESSKLSSPRAEGRRRRMAHLDSFAEEGSRSARVGNSPRKLGTTGNKGPASARLPQAVAEEEEEGMAMEAEMPPVEDSRCLPGPVAKGKAVKAKSKAKASSSPQADRQKIHEDRQSDRQVEKLWNVMTNSKVRTQSLADKSVSNERDNRQAPTHIEGIAPLMLAKLYQGPWRLDV